MTSAAAPNTTAGTTTIADPVVATVAGLAAREVAGVHAVGGGGSRAVEAVRERVPGAGRTARPGVGVEVGERRAAVEVTLVVEYGVAIVDVAAAARRNIAAAVARITGLEVVEVTVSVTDVHVPGDDA